jgi:hypothetical protein
MVRHPGNRDPEALGARGPLDRAQRGARTEHPAVEAQHADPVRPPRDQSPCERVRAVVELPHRGDHAFARLGADVRVVVEDPRDGLVGDAREGGHVVHHRPPALVGHPLRPSSMATS